MSKIGSVTRKELWSHFTSPTALLFLGTYLFVNLFIFFWVEKFFSRNIADLRPLFEWMPVLLIFLISTLTMKMWSEERRMGTVEFLLTLPVKTYELVLGKFFACLTLVAVALSLTLGLALTVGLLGKVDGGPVIGAYTASLLLAGAYIAIGLYISSRSESQIVSLISTVFVSYLFYMIGSQPIVDLMGNKTGEILKLIGTGSRFEAISRGVLDFRDVYYYLSLTAVFLIVNVYSLEKLKWSSGTHNSSHWRATVGLSLLAANLLGANLWLSQIPYLRSDITQTRMFSISSTTKDMLKNLSEPLLIRGYFSARTHPLLAPLVPAIRDTLKEFEISSKGKLRFEFIDPKDHPDLEADAQRKYQIEPFPFQLADRYSASMVASYFNIVLEYGDQHVVLGFDDLIEVKQMGIGNIDVRLRNLEYDVAKSIRKIVKSFNTPKDGEALASDEPNQKHLPSVGIVSPPAPQADPMMAQFGMPPPSGKSFNFLRKKLEENYKTETVDLDSGSVDKKIDILMVLAPKELKDVQLYAIDQFLMKGGTVIFATSPISVAKSQTGFQVEGNISGLDDWLKFNGITIPKELVLDKQNVGFPEIHTRTLPGGVTVREPRIGPYPLFLDLRDSEFGEKGGIITSSLGQLTMPWPSPIEVNKEQNTERKVVNLLTSSASSWRTSDIQNILPNRELYPELGFEEPKSQKREPLGVLVEGKFTSYFKDKPLPQIKKEEGQNPEAAQAATAPELPTLIAESPNISKVIIYASNEFIADDTVQIMSMVSGTQYLNTLQLLENTLDWSTEDESLLNIRSRSHFSRTLYPLSEVQKNFWEITNYIFAVFGLTCVFFLSRRVRIKAIQRAKKFQTV